MEDNFNNRDFEQFLKQNADQYRMFPSEKVWTNIDYALHTRRRWYGLGLSVLLLTTAIVTWVMLTPSVRNNESVTASANTQQQLKQSERKNTTEPDLILTAKQTDNKTRFFNTTDNLQRNLFVSGPTSSLTDNNNYTYEKNDDPVTIQNTKEPVVIAASIKIELPAKPALANNKQIIYAKPADNKTLPDLPKNSLILVSENNNTDKPAPDINPTGEKRDINLLTIESVVNSYKHQRTGKKLSWEAFITPTISYRKLSENKEFVNSAQTNNNIYNYYNSVADINSLVTHKPDMGLQAGFNAGYPLTKSLKIIGGFQFNVSKYDIRVSYSTGDVATIALNTGGGANSVSTISNYRNNSSGSKADWLRNLYFSASVPVGVELKLSGNNKTQIGVIGTVQPSYILSDRAYLLTTDYKNYAEVPSLTRKWNMSTSFEIYAGVSTGKINWRIGPQVRYQLKSSYVAKYPFKEHLFDFGLKLGVMLKK